MENGTKGRVKQGLLFKLTEVSGRLHEFQNIDITFSIISRGVLGLGVGVWIPALPSYKF